MDSPKKAEGKHCRTRFGGVGLEDRPALATGFHICGGALHQVVVKW